MQDLVGTGKQRLPFGRIAFGQRRGGDRIGIRAPEQIRDLVDVSRLRVTTLINLLNQGLGVGRVSYRLR